MGFYKKSKVYIFYEKYSYANNLIILRNLSIDNLLTLSGSCGVSYSLSFRAWRQSMANLRHRQREYRVNIFFVIKEQIMFGSFNYSYSCLFLYNDIQC